MYHIQFSLFICQGTSFELAALLKFNKTMNLTSSYYITLLAHDPSLEKTFQVRVDEREYGSLDLTVAIARPKKDQNEGDLCCIVHFYINTSQEYKIKSHLLINNVS